MEFQKHSGKSCLTTSLAGAQFATADNAINGSPLTTTTDPVRYAAFYAFNAIADWGGFLTVRFGYEQPPRI